MLVQLLYYIEDSRLERNNLLLYYIKENRLARTNVGG